MKWIELYKSYDGEAAGAVRLTLHDHGQWTVEDYFGRSKNSPYLKGSLLETAHREIDEFLARWRREAQPMANGWAEPQFRGCCGPIFMGAVRVDGIEIHFRDDPARQKVVEELLDAVSSRIPELALHEWLRQLLLRSC